VTTAPPSLLLRDVEVDGTRVDVFCRDGRIAAISPPSGGTAGADVEIDGDGGALLPGLHDHHIHLLATAAALDSVDASGPAGGDAITFAAALRQAAAPGAWVRVVGYDESTAGPLDRWSLDRLAGDRPVRVQHRSGALWVLNSAAVRAAGLDDDGDIHDVGDVDGLERDTSGRATGRLWRLDGWLRSRIPAQLPDLASVGEQLRRLGITGVTDTTPTDDPAAIEWIARAVGTGDLPQRVVVTGGLDLAPDHAPELARGPVKLVLSDHDLPSPPELVEAVRLARERQRPVAIHSVTAESLALAVTALRAVGAVAGDRIEHAAVVLPGLLEELASLGPTVVTSPAMVRSRGDRYLADVDPVELPHLWPCRSLLNADVAVAAGSDAPFGPVSPWLAIDAASTRTTSTGALLGGHERVTPRQALGLFLTPLLDPGGSERRLTPGADADLCLLDRPLWETLETPERTTVVATIIAGRPGEMG
jgi:predicted amidohydrolase YtcJ